MSLTKLQIANAALAKIGQSAIANFTDDNPRVVAVNALYDFALESVLRVHNWSFAATRVSLVKDNDAPAWGFSAKYRLPNDFIRLIRLEQKSADFKVERPFLLTDGAEGKILYIRKEEDTTVYAPLFTRALTARLASDLCKQLTGDSTTHTVVMEREFDKYLDEARYIDQLEGTPPDVGHVPSHYREARINGDKYRAIEGA